MDRGTIQIPSTNTSDITNTGSQTIHHELISQVSNTKDASTTASLTSSSLNKSSPNKISTNFTTDPPTQIMEHTTQQTASKSNEYSQIPYNSARPPPYTYQRQHDFPPFPPLERHPVLPFLTTAFSDQNHRQCDSSQTIKHRTLTTAATKPSTSQRTVQNHVSTIPTMDVSKNDTTAIFIRPPFVVPASPEGEEAILGSTNNPPPGTPVTYAILHQHRNWFLDPDDFEKDNPNRIEYPADLEPPRGWAPLNECLDSGVVKKQKEKLNSVSRTKGSYIAPDLMGVIEYGPSDDCHELTVLRCTFCRREYHGPNAKSMWRRHVYDKHKVAMKNRREGSAGSAIRSVLKRSKSKESSESFDMLPSKDAPLSPLDLDTEQNMIRLLERVVSGDLHLNLPAFILGSSNTIDLQTIANALQRGGLIMSLHDNNVEIASALQLESNTSSQSTDQGDSLSTSESPEAELNRANSGGRAASPESPRSSRRKTGETEKTKSLLVDRTPLKDNTFADRSYHNATMTPPGTPWKDKTKQQKTMPRSPVTRLTQNTPILSPKPIVYNSYTRSLTSTALRARALATTGEESYLTFPVSSPSTATNTPLKHLGHIASPSTNRLSPFSKVKNRAPETTNDDFGILGIPPFRFPFIDFNNVEASSNALDDSAPTSDPVEVDSKGSASPSANLAPPASVDENLSRLKPNTRTIKAAISKQNATTIECSECSLSQNLQRRRCNKNDDQGHDEDFDMEHFLDLKDSDASLSNPPSSPQKAPLPRGFAKEFGLLSQEEVDRITESLRPGSGENLRPPKRRRIHSPLS